MSEYLKRLQARDSRIGCVNSSTDARMCSLIGCHERIRGAQDAFGLPIPCATQESFAAPPSKQRALIIASPGCYELASAQAHAAGIHDVTLAPAVHGTEAGRSPADGVVQAHRGVWRSILQAGRPGIVLEEDAHFIGDRTDVTSALARCEAVGCDLAYLGIAGDVRCAYGLESTRRTIPHRSQALRSALCAVLPEPRVPRNPEGGALLAGSRDERKRQQTEGGLRHATSVSRRGLGSVLVVQATAGCSVRSCQPDHPLPATATVPAPPACAMASSDGGYRHLCSESFLSDIICDAR